MANRPKILVIVESPAKTDTIMKYAPKDNDYLVLASRGHIADLGKSGKYHLGIDIENDFSLQYVLDPAKRERLEAMINAAAVSEKILIATDNDTEGEVIGALIRDRLKTCKKPIKRVTFVEITKEGIAAGLNNEREIDENLVSSGKARRALDRIVGYMGSPFIIKRLGNNVSAGRVQSVALRMVVDREKEIQEFKPEEYWTIKANLVSFAKDPFVANYFSKETLKNKEEADNLKLELESSSFKVSKVIAKPRKRSPQAPLNTAKLQMAASSKYKLSPSKTMAAAQSLYEQGFITYMRTDSLRISNEALIMVRSWISANHPSCLPEKAVFYKNKNSAQDAHECIRPSNIGKLPVGDPRTDTDKVYKVIWKIFVACQMTPAIYDTVSVTIHTNKNRELRTNGSILRDPGWLVMTTNMNDDSADDKENKLPALIVDDILTIADPGIIAEQKFTQPPSRYKEPTLIEELERNGIGRPSTYASIMGKICETRNFVEKKNDILIPTESGTNVVDLLSKYFSFMEYNFTIEMEKKLDLIKSGECSYVDTMKEFFALFQKDLHKAYNDCESDTEYVCNKCSAPMILKKSTFGYFLGCSKYPECKNIVDCKVNGTNITIAVAEKSLAPEGVTCPRCKEKMFIKGGKYGEYYCCFNYPNCLGSRKKPFGKKCPTCGDELFRTIFNNPPLVGAVLCCMTYPKCKYVEPLNEPKALRGFKAYKS